jgi:hypothetical protein
LGDPPTTNTGTSGYASPLARDTNCNIGTRLCPLWRTTTDRSGGYPTPNS